MLLRWLLERLVEMANKKIVFIIVEGSSDETALACFFKMLFDPNEVYIHVEHGDITSRKEINSSNIINNIAFRVKQYAKKYKLQNTDFDRIIHIIDTDGAFIPDANVVFGSCLPDPLYDLTEIKTANVSGICLRNQNKRNNIIKLVSTNAIWKIQYKAFYMSCNLDHVLYNKLNSTDEEKEDDSFDFFEKYENDYQGFVDYICNSDFSVHMQYKESWKFIREGLNSLNRYTNVNLCFDESSTI